MKRAHWNLAAVVMTAAIVGGCGPGGEDHPGGTGSSSSSGNVSSSSTECSDVVCALYCEAGFKRDANGCEVCSCNEPTTDCGDIVDQYTCSSTPHCVVVYGDPTTSDRAEPAPEDPSGAPVAPPPEDFRCCTLADDGTVSCGDDVPPPPQCYSDYDCGAGYRCEISACDTPCGTGEAPSDGSGAAPVQCLVACGGQCVPSEDRCQGAWLDQSGVCRTPADGVYPPECCGVEPAGCLSDSECGADEYCEISACGAGFAPPADDDGNGGDARPVQCQGYCAPREQPVTCYADSDCNAESFCKIDANCTNTCGAPDDGSSDRAPCLVACSGVCAPREEPTTSCFSDSECSEGLICDTVNYCDSACEPTTDSDQACLAVCMGRCVPPTTPDVCAAATCEAGTICKACEPNMDCEFQCVPVEQDECSQLSESECALDYDLCSPVYATACAACEQGDAACDPACETRYAGCQRIPG